jgi:hypothetical protein
MLRSIAVFVAKQTPQIYHEGEMFCCLPLKQALHIFNPAK